MNITVTGADVRTDLSALKSLDAEIGILVTATPEGRNRYPALEWIAQAALVLPRVAIHICGRIARFQLANQKLSFVKHARRIQVNGVLDIRECEELCRTYPDQTIITQHKPDNKYLLAVKAKNHAVLVDGSGGRGLSPEVWKRPDTAKEVGFAGGLGPDNLAGELADIERVATGDWWIDMEGKLRVDDWFSVERAEAAISVFKAYQPTPARAGCDGDVNA